MKVYLATYDCADCGNGLLGAFTSRNEAQRACADDVHQGTVKEWNVEDKYITHSERLRAERIARGADPETGKELERRE